MNDIQEARHRHHRRWPGIFRQLYRNCRKRNVMVWWRVCKGKPLRHKLPVERKATVKKWFRGSLGSKALLPYHFVGYHKDRKGIVWRVYSPTVNQLSAWARLE